MSRQHHSLWLVVAGERYCSPADGHSMWLICADTAEEAAAFMTPLQPWVMGPRDNSRWALKIAHGLQVQQKGVVLKGGPAYYDGEIYSRNWVMKTGTKVEL